MNKIRLAIVDDHEPLRNGIIKILATNENVEVLLTATTGRDFVSQIQNLSIERAPDLVLLDSRMPDMDGAETVRWIKRERKTMKILMLSMFDNTELVLRMLAMGVHGYITKTSEPSELFAAISMVMKKGFYYSPFIAEKVIESLHSKKLKLNFAYLNTGLEDIDQNLTAREKVYLTYACTGLRTAEIAVKMSITPNTVEVYKTNIFKKFKVNNSVSMVLVAQKLDLSPNKQNN